MSPDEIGLHASSWDGLGRIVNESLKVVAENPAIERQAHMLALNFMDAINARIGEWPIDAEGELPAAAMMFAGLHVLGGLREAAGLPDPEVAGETFPPLER